jgi:hypothetical protein
MAVAGLGVLNFGGLLFYYGGSDAQEYRWRGPVAAVVILAVCITALVALQHPALRGWMRAIGYIALIPIGAGLSGAAAATYLDERCQDPEYLEGCGIVGFHALWWAIVAGACVVALIVAAESIRHLSRRRVAR